VFWLLVYQSKRKQHAKEHRRLRQLIGDRAQGNGMVIAFFIDNFA
jgi:hypothetical protein